MSQIVISRHPRLKFGFVADIISDSVVLDSFSFAKNENSEYNYYDLMRWIDSVNKNGGYDVLLSNGSNLSGANVSKP